MKISYNHLIECIQEKPDIYELSERLFQLGHEHELIGDIFDLELTPNRGDCLSTKGLLRDLSQFYQIKFLKEIYDKDIADFNFNFTNNAIQACPKISFFKIDIESIPDNYNNEVESYFSDLNVKKNNFFTDLSNYLSYETGQPTHCYEASKIEAGISLDFSDEKIMFDTLLDKKIEIDSGNLIFLDNRKKIINLAGIVGGANTSCSTNTTSAIIECAYFNPEVILGKAVKFSINSEASHKFERNVDPHCHEYVIRRFIKLVQEHTNILKIEACINDYGIVPEKIIDLNAKQISNIIGVDISEQDCVSYLQKFGFIIDKSNVHVPSYRHDISGINDIAEEIARAIGYDNIYPEKFNLYKNKNQKNTNEKELKIKNLLVSNGFFEVINHPFTKEHNETSIELDNPLDVNRKFLRTSLKNSLLDNLLYNERRQQDSIKLFEISDIYTNDLQSPKKLIGIITSGRVDKNYQDFNKKLDKKYLEDFLKEFIGKQFILRCEDISRDNIQSKSKNKIAYAEIELDESFDIDYLQKNSKRINLDIKYVPVSDYPSSIRDLSFSIKDYSKCAALQNFILDFKDDLLKDVFIFDYFLNKENVEIKIGFRFIFQSNNLTITEEEVNKVISHIIKYTTSIDGVAIPGLE